MESLQTLLELLRQHDLKITPQRRLILEMLTDDDSHPTADEVYQRVLGVMPDVSRTTVYNTLHEMVDLGLLREVQNLSPSGLRYDTNNGPHHHLFCTQCHALVDLEHDFGGINLAPDKAAGYRIMRPQVTFHGICPDCQEQNEV